MSLFGFEEASKVFIYARPTDMRKGFDGLCGLVVNHMELDPRQGYLFVFMNRPRTLIKVLLWDRDGLALYYKRLEKGSFKRPTSNINAPNSELSKDELFMILRGIDFDVYSGDVDPPVRRNLTPLEGSLVYVIEQ